MTRAVWIAWLLMMAACSDAGGPPVLGDPTGNNTPVNNTGDASSTEPCSTPSKGCPCSNPGEQVYCGTIYRISGTHVDCSKGYVTCQADNKWSACEGATIFMGD